LTSPATETFEWITGLFFSREENFRTEGFVFPSLGRSDRLRAARSLCSRTRVRLCAYGQASYGFTDRFKITGGVRYSRKRRKSLRRTHPLRIATALQAYPQIAADKSWGNVSWRLVADYHATDSMLFYASVATGFKSWLHRKRLHGSSGCRSFDPEEATNYEVGARPSCSIAGSG